MNENDGVIIQQVLSGNGDCFRVLVERYSHSVFRLAFRMTGNESDAEDVVQETFLRAYRSLAQFDSRASFSTWLYRIAANYSLDWLAAKKRRAWQQEQPADEDQPGGMPNVKSKDPSVDRLVFSGQIQERLEGAMAELTAQERTAFVLRHYEDQSIEEISAALGVGVSATKNSIFRAVQKLRRSLAPLVSAT